MSTQTNSEPCSNCGSTDYTVKSGRWYDDSLYHENSCCGYMY